MVKMSKYRPNVPKFLNLTLVYPYRLVKIVVRTQNQLIMPLELVLNPLDEQIIHRDYYIHVIILNVQKLRRLHVATNQFVLAE